MSEFNFKRSFANPLVNKLNAEVRKKVERQKGQLLLLPSVADIENALTDIKYDKSRLEIAYNAGRQKALVLQKSYTSTRKGKLRYNRLREKWGDIKFKHAGLKLAGISADVVTDETAFLVSNFKSSINSVKKAILNELNLSVAAKKEASFKFHKGHGEGGLAVSQVQIASAFARTSIIEGVSPQDLADLFESFITEADMTEEYKKDSIAILKELKSTYVNVVSPDGTLKGEYFSIITFQSSGDNQLDKKFEQAFITQFRKFISSQKLQNFIEQENSPSINKKLKGFFTHTFESSIKSSRVRKTKSKLPKPGSKSTGKARVKKKIEDSTLTLNEKTKRRKKLQQKETSKKTPELDVLHLKALINAKLPATVRKNMVAPGLINRTGRFAASAQVENIIVTDKGFPSIGHTYQKFPYQTFEPGYSKGNIDRDPRRVIDKSVREIANDLLAGRFYTRSL